MKGTTSLNSLGIIVLSLNFHLLQCTNWQLLQTIENTEIEERLVDYINISLSSGPLFDYYNFHNLGEIYDHVKNMSEFNSMITVKDMGAKTFEGNVIKLVHIALNDTNPAIVIECGINAQQWISPAVCLYFMKKLEEEGMNGPLKSFQFYIVPVLNPDGYRYTWSGIENSRLWQKNRRVRNCTDEQLDDSEDYAPKDNTKCYGVELNRNFGSSFKNESILGMYSGKLPSSESESRAMNETMDNIMKNNSVVAYLAIHSALQKPRWLLPTNYSDIIPINSINLRKIANEAVSTLKAVRGNSYYVGRTIDYTSVAYGTSTDWAFDDLEIPFVYSVEVFPPSNDTDRKLIINVGQLKPTLEETWGAFETVFKAIHKEMDHTRRKVASKVNVFIFVGVSFSILVFLGVLWMSLEAFAKFNGFNSYSDYSNAMRQPVYRQDVGPVQMSDLKDKDEGHYDPFF